MRLIKNFIGLGAVLVLGACASTSGPKDFGKLEYTGFTEKPDGSVVQSVLGLTCPAEIDGIIRTSTKVYNDAGTDAGCNYSNPDRILTVYLSQYPDDTLGGNFRAAQYHIENRFTPQGYELDDDLSELCGAQSLDAMSLMSGLSGVLSGTDQNTEVTISQTPSAVYVSLASGKMTLVTVEEPFEKEFFKTRYSGPYKSTDDVEEICGIIRQNYLDMTTSIKSSRGIEDKDALSRLLKSELDGR